MCRPRTGHISIGLVLAAELADPNNGRKSRLVRAVFLIGSFFQRREEEGEERRGRRGCCEKFSQLYWVTRDFAIEQKDESGELVFKLAPVLAFIQPSET